MTYSTTIGHFELISLQVWALQQYPTREVLSEFNAEDLEQARRRQPQFFGNDTTLVELTQNICVIRSSEQIILVDTGDSLKRAGAILQWGLASLGIKPEEVNIVFLTHRDDDHVGGTVDLQGKPIYSNARYLMSRREYESFKNDTARQQQFQKWIQPLETRGIVELLEDKTEIAKGLTTLSTPGHRPGATSLRLQDGNQAALLLADTLHLPIQITYPELSSVWDSDKEIAATTRHQIIEQAEHENLLLAVPHIPFGGLGYVGREGKYKIWSPPNSHE